MEERKKTQIWGHWGAEQLLNAPKVELRPPPSLRPLPPPCGQAQEQFPARGGPARPRKGKGEARTAPSQLASGVSLQPLGFVKGMSFPIASIAVVNSVLFGIYSSALQVLTATSHQERRAQPPSYTHVFIGSCTGGSCR